MLQTVRPDKVDEKKWSHLSSFHVPSLSYGPYLSKKVHFLQFCAEFSNKSKFIKAIYIYASERSHFALSEYSIVSYAMIYCFGDIKVWSQIILLNFCWVGIFFHILIANISWTVAETPINHIIFWMSVMRSFRCIYVNFFNRLRFLAEISTKLQRLHFFGHFKDHNLRSKHEN